MAANAKFMVAADVLNADGSRRPIRPTGRDAWALRELMRAGPQGVTPLERPAPRWSAYVHNLRREWGVDIVTLDEPHDGPFPGRHGRYVLRSRVTLRDCP